MSIALGPVLKGGLPDRMRIATRCLCLLGALCTGPAPAPTASQITPPSFSPPLQSQEGGLTIPDGQSLEAPAGADKLSVRVRRLTLSVALQF